MKVTWVLILLLWSSACGGQQAPPVAGAADTLQTQDPEASPEPQPLPPMPEYPAASRQRLVGLSAGGSDTVQGSWPAWAASCDEPRALQISAQTAEVGTMILFHFSPSMPQVSSYPVAIQDSGFPRPPAVQLAAQIATASKVRAFRAVSGTAELLSFDRAVSGRFAVTLQELESRDSLRFVGTFEKIRMEQARTEDCEAIAVTQADTTANADAR